jgi:hypothetical protein
MPDRYALACISRPIRTRSKPFGFIQPPPADLRSSAGDGSWQANRGPFSTSLQNARLYAFHRGREGLRSVRAERRLDDTGNTA